MKAGEARSIYSAQISALQEQRGTLLARKKELEKKSSSIPNGKELFAEEAATLQLSLERVTKKYDESRDYMERIMQAYTAGFNAEATRQQSEAMEEYAEDLAKIVEVARRIADGAIVPPKDEQKLMEYSMEMYMAAKNMAALNELKEKEEYESLWEEEKEPGEYDPEAAGNNMEVSGEAPEIIDVETGVE